MRGVRDLLRLTLTALPVALTTGVLGASVVGMAQADAAAAPLTIHPAFLAGVAAVLGALALVLKVLPGAFRGNADRDLLRTLSLIEQQQEQIQRVTGLLESQHESSVADRVVMQAIAGDMGRIAASFDRALDRLSALTLEVEQVQRDMRLHEQGAKTTREQLHELHRHFLRKGSEG